MTKLYFTDTTKSVSGLTSEQSSLTSDFNMESQTTNRSLSTVKGNDQIIIFDGSIATTAQREYYFSRFVSEPLGMASIDANTWTYAFAAYQGNSNANFPVSGTNKPVHVNCYVWRPSTQSKVGTILDGNTASTVDEASGGQKVGHVVTFSGSAVSGMQIGDVLVFEIWFIVTQSAANSYTIAWYYNGDTEPTENKDEAGVDMASYISTPQDITFESGLQSVEQSSIQKYDIKEYVTQTSTHKYHVSHVIATSKHDYKIKTEFDGFTIFMRLYIPFLNNEVIYGRRGVLFSKLDDEQVTHGYAAQISKDGDIYFIVRYNSREYTLTALNAVNVTTSDIPDFAEEDFNSQDYFTLASANVLPDIIPYEDVAFTFEFLTRRMQVIVDGQVVADTNNNPEGNGLVGHWRLTEGGDIGDSVTEPQTFSRIAYNSIESGNNGTITNATWDNTTFPHETYLSFNASDSRVSVNDYAEITGPTSVTVSLWYYHRDLPNSTNYFIRKNPTGQANNWTMYSDGSFVRMRIRNQDNTVYDATFNNAFPTTNTWYHVVGKWTMGQAVKISVDNSKVTGDTTAGTLSGTGDLRIGNFTDNTVDGFLFDVKVWDREISDSEETTLFNAGRLHAGFPPWTEDPPPPPEQPEPITNPFVVVYDLPKPSSNWEWQKLHKLVASGFTDVYTTDDGVTISEETIPFSTVYDFQTVGGGGGGTTTTVYDQPVDAGAGAHLEFEDGISRAGIRFDSGNANLNEAVTQVVVRFRKQGSPGGTVSVGIRKASDDSFVSLGSFDIGSFGDGEQEATINAGSNTYAMQANDIVSVEYPSGSDTIELSYAASGVSNFTSIAYDGSWTTSNPSDLTHIAMKIQTTSGGGSGEVPFKGDDSYLGNGIYAVSGGVLDGVTPTRATFKLKRTPTSPGGTVRFRVYNSSGSFTELGNMSANDVSTTATDYTFTNLNQTRVLSANDWVGVVITGSSSNSSNYISSHSGDGVTNGATEVRLTDTTLPPFIGTSFSWKTQDTTDCIGKLEVGGTTEPAKLHYYNLDGGSIRAVGERLRNSSSVLYNQKITKVKPKLKAVGNPTGTIHCRIRNSSGTWVSSCGSIEADTVSPTDFQEYEFTNLLQGRSLASGDRVMIEYTGTSTDYIQIMIQWDESHGGALGNEQVTTFNGSSYSNVEADISGAIQIGGTATDPDARERVGEKAETDTSILKLTKPSRVNVWLRKVGSPPNDVFCRIRRVEDDSTVAVIGQITASTITTDTAGEEKEFTKSPVSIYAMQENDYLLIEYPDGDDNNYIEVAVTTTDQIDSTDSILLMYDSLFTDYDVLSNQDLIAKIEEGGDTFTPTGDEIPDAPPPKYTHDLHIFAGGYPYDYYTDQEDTTIENWVSAICPDIRFYRRVMTTTELNNIFVNRRDISGLPKGQVAVIGFFSLSDS